VLNLLVGWCQTTSRPVSSSRAPCHPLFLVLPLPCLVVSPLAVWPPSFFVLRSVSPVRVFFLSADNYYCTTFYCQTVFYRP